MRYSRRYMFRGLSWFNSFLFLILFLDSPFKLQSQSKIDSLLQELKTPKPDTSRIKSLNALSWLYIQNANYKPALIYTQEALALSEKIDFTKGKAKALIQLGNIYSYQNKQTEAIETFSLSIEAFERVGDNFGVSDAYSNIGSVYQKQGNISAALDHYQHALKICESIGDKYGIAKRNSSIASILAHQGKYEEAIEKQINVLLTWEEMKNKRDLASSHVEIGMSYYYQGNHTLALDHLFAGLKLHDELKNKRGLSSCLLSIGLIYNSQAKYKEALTKYSEAMKICEEIGDKACISSCAINVAMVHKNQGHYPEALENLILSLRIAEELNDLRLMANSYSSLAGYFNSQGSFKEAISYSEKALKLNKEIADPIGLLNSYIGIGDLYYAKDDYDKAYENYSQALQISDRIDYPKGKADSHTGLGNIKYVTSQFKNAIVNYNIALDIYKKLNDKNNMANMYNNICGAYFELKDFPQAKKFIQEGLSLSIEIGSIWRIKESYDMLFNLDSATGNWENAFRNNQLFQMYRDSMDNEENNRKILQSLMRYEFAKKEDSLRFQQQLTEAKLRELSLLTQQREQSLELKEKELLLSNTEKELQRSENEKQQANLQVQIEETGKKQAQLNYLSRESVLLNLALQKEKLLKNFTLVGLGLFVMLSFFIYSNYRTRQKLKLQTLRDKIASDLHDDVGSTLSSISIFSQMAQAQSKEVIPLLETIGESSRKMLDAMADIVWTINPENDQFEKIILRMRSFAYELLGAKGIDFEFLADEEISKIKLPMDVRKNLYLIFKEATNNLVKYANANKAMFAIKGGKDNLIMMIRDNGKGFDANLIVQGNGIRNMKRRAEEIGGMLIIETFPGQGTTIQLKIAV